MVDEARPAFQVFPSKKERNKRFIDPLLSRELRAKVREEFGPVAELREPSHVNFKLWEKYTGGRHVDPPELGMIKSGTWKTGKEDYELLTECVLEFEPEEGRVYRLPVEYIQHDYGLGG